MANLEHSPSGVADLNRLSSTSNKQQRTTPEILDISTDRGNETDQEMSDLEKANSGNSFPVHDQEKAKRDATRIVDYQKLIKAIQRGDLFKINEIARNKNDDLFRKTSPNGNSVLHIAARYRNWVVVEQILRRDDKNESFIYKRNGDGETPLHIAAKYGHMLVFLFLLFHEKEETMKQKGLLKMKDKEGNTALHNAVRHGHELIAQILIGCDETSVLEVNNSEQSPLSIAIDGRLNYIARFMIEKDPSILDPKGHEELPLLHSAVIRQDYDMVVDILKKRKDLTNNVDHEKQWTSLHYAAASGHVKIARYLAKVNAELVYKPDKNGQTPVHLAAKNDRPGVLKMLLKDYPDSIEMNDNRRRNILHVAAQNGKVKIVAFILKLPEIDDLVNSRDEDGNTPLHLAAMEFQSDVVYTFSKCMNVNIRAINRQKQTALAIVETSTLKGKDVHKHLTTKALKAAYADRGLCEEDIQLEHRRVQEAAHPGRSMSAPAVLQQKHMHPLNVALSERAQDIEGMPLEHTIFAGVEDKDGEGCRRKEMAQTLSLMNTLIATFTFTAAFTIPGGFKEEGTAILVDRASFQAFVIADTISMTSSMTAAVIVFWSFWCSKSESFMDSLPWAIGLTWIGLVSMTLAFVTGLYVVLSENMVLAITVSAIGCGLPLILYVLAPFISLVSGQSANVNPLAFSFKMVKLFLKKPIGWCFLCLSKRIRLPTPTKSKTYMFVALPHKFLYGLIYYWIKALVIAVPRWIKELVIAPSGSMKALVTGLPLLIKALVEALPRRMKALVTLYSLCSPRMSREISTDELPLANVRPHFRT